MTTPAQPQIHPRANTALIISIVGLFILGLVLGAIAIYIGVRARGDIDYSQGALTGRGRATAAIVIGIFEIVLWTVGVAATIIVTSTV